jgi:hypothetical protein
LVTAAKANAPTNRRAQATSVIGVLQTWKKQIATLSGQVARGRAGAKAVSAFEKKWTKADIKHWAPAYASLTTQAGQLAKATAQAATWAKSSNPNAHAMGEGLAAKLSSTTHAKGSPAALANTAAGALLSKSPRVNYSRSASLAPMRALVAKPIVAATLSGVYAQLLAKVDLAKKQMVTLGDQLYQTLLDTADQLEQQGYVTNAGQVRALAEEVKAGMPVLIDVLVQALTDVINALAKVDITNPAAIKAALKGQTGALTGITAIANQFVQWGAQYQAIGDNLHKG